MLITLVALMCHVVPVSDGKTVEACHQEIVWEGNEGLGVCGFGQAIIAQWKNAGRFKGDEWSIKRYQCIPGGMKTLPNDHI